MRNKKKGTIGEGEEVEEKVSREKVEKIVKRDR